MNELARLVMGSYWANEASPSLGCSIEISCYIYMSVCTVGMSVSLQKYVCQNAWVELRGPNTRMLKVSFGGYNRPVTPAAFISTIL